MEKRGFWVMWLFSDLVFSLENFSCFIFFYWFSYVVDVKQEFNIDLRNIFRSYGMLLTYSPILTLFSIYPGKRWCYAAIPTMVNHYFGLGFVGKKVWFAFISWVLATMYGLHSIFLNICKIINQIYERHLY